MLNDQNVPVVHVTNFSKKYGSGKKESFACKDVSLSFSAGTITGLLGPNGAGKTTILKAISGIHYPTEGCVSIQSLAGESQELSFIRQCTGYVPETPELDTSLTVKETLSFSAAIHGLEGSEASHAIEEAVALCELESVYSKKVALLSKGFTQRTSFAKALAFNPSVLVLDEFSDGLDPAQIVRMRNVISKLSETKAVLLSTHHIEEAVALCKNVYIIAQGKIVSSGAVADVIATAKKNTLEEAFLSLTGASV
jgi:ABC-2 type transport system ATP-binding protein